MRRVPVNQEETAPGAGHSLGSHPSPSLGLGLPICRRSVLTKPECHMGLRGPELIWPAWCF